MKGSQVRLGVEAPPELSIHRDEVWERIMEENRKAATVTPDQMDMLVRHYPPPRPKRGKGGDPERKGGNQT